MEIYRLITSTEVETVIKNLPIKQKPRTIQLHSWILSNIKGFNTYPSKTLPPHTQENFGKEFNLTHVNKWY